MIKELPASLLETALELIEKQRVLNSCTSCGAVVGSCVHTDGLQEDEVTALNVANSEEPEEQLSGKKEEIEINPEYKTFIPRRP